MMEITEGSHAVADAVRFCRPQVISAYPITPQTHIVEALADMVANCQLDAEYITVENELSALSACIGASAAGSRTYSATTSQGLALMFEVCFNAAGMRLPIVMSIANRALGAPLSIWNDQQDSISLRDAQAGSSSMPRTTRKQPICTTLPTGLLKTIPSCSRHLSALMDSSCRIPMNPSICCHRKILIGSFRNSPPMNDLMLLIQSVSVCMPHRIIILNSGMIWTGP